MFLSGCEIIVGVGSTLVSSNFLFTCNSNDAAVPTIMFRPLAHAGTLSASRLVTNVDDTPSKPGDHTESGLSGNV